MSDRHSFSLDNFYVRSDNVRCPTVILSTVLRHLMTSWHLNISKFKIGLSQEQKELSKWNKKHFSLFHKSSRHTKQTSNNVTDATFKNWQSLWSIEHWHSRILLLTGKSSSIFYFWNKFMKKIQITEQGLVDSLT